MSTLVTLFMNLVAVAGALHSKEVLLEHKGEHKGDKVEILQEGDFYK